MSNIARPNAAPGTELGRYGNPAKDWRGRNARSLRDYPQITQITQIKLQRFETLDLIIAFS